MNRKRLSLRYYGDPVLRKKAEPIAASQAEIKELVEAMFDCMYLEAGVGLAGPQVGISSRVFVVDVTDGEGVRTKRAFVNPEIVERTGAVTGEEGCLSIPGIRADVKRAARIVVKATDEDGTPFRLAAEGLLSRAIQHETDHLDGVLFVDRLSAIKRKLLEGRLKRVRPPAAGSAEPSQTTPSL
ncbi:MAG TPA: peptide deformylase [Candidatus Eisenbacteria bacterium]|nr:peptide deformylase [Candidatus Eisenbacteria bacterium]